jgi:hypothetical protein
MLTFAAAGGRQRLHTKCGDRRRSRIVYRRG